MCRNNLEFYVYSWNVFCFPVDGIFLPGWKKILNLEFGVVSTLKFKNIWGVFSPSGWSPNLRTGWLKEVMISWLQGIVLWGVFLLARLSLLLSRNVDDVKLFLYPLRMNLNLYLIPTIKWPCAILEFSGKTEKEQNWKSFERKLLKLLVCEITSIFLK